jgi:NAD(P)-dependent dehydrogenase (short-subunit alcohol dehydrogenase family)
MAHGPRSDPSRFSVEGKRVIVTGASSGLGRQFALTLAEEGAHVALAARRRTLLEELASEIEDFGGTAVPVTLDVTDNESIDDAVRAATEAFGGLDVLVNNSGVVIHKPLLEHTQTDWDAVVGVNLKGAWFMAQAAARRMVEQGTGGSIVNIASIIGHGRIAMQIPEYLASKGGLIQLTKAMGTELARHKVRVNALAPGYIETDFNREFLRSDQGARLIRGIPQRRPGQLRELDGALLLLCSDASTFMTGTVVSVDGGHSVTSV